MNKILIIGATSAIAQAVAKIYATQGNKLFLIGRNETRLKIIADDLTARSSHNVSFYAADLNDFTQHQQLLMAAKNILEKIDMVFIAHGSLPDQKNCELSFAETLQQFSTNSLSVISLLTLLANDLEQQKSGCIAVITSVAGDRGRQSNYVYGSAKAMLDTFLQGLRNRLYATGVNVVTLKPGFVDTPMTQHLKKGLLFSQPDKVAQQIVKAIAKKKCIAYVPSYWRIIMFIIKAMPETIFRRLKL